jgi:hypothetical protein
MIVSDLYPTTRRLLMGRTVSDAFLAEYIRKGILELSEGYKFAGLQAIGPVVQFVVDQVVYDPDYFMHPADAGLEINKINSFFMYTGTTPPGPPPANNSGYNLKFRTIDVLEVLLNIPGEPIYWSRHDGRIWIASVPAVAHYTYARYQKEHPFPNAGTPTAGADSVLLPNSWQDILEYQSAMRAAQELNLSTKVTELHTRLYGDEKFQRTAGLEGQPGLIFQRTSQENRDQTTSRKTFRLKMGSV